MTLRKCKIQLVAIEIISNIYIKGADKHYPSVVYNMCMMFMWNVNHLHEHTDYIIIMVQI